MNMKPEHGLAILKPDGVRKGMDEEFIKELDRHDLKIVHVSKRHLSKQQVLESFTSDFNMDIYADYLSSGEVMGYLVKGHYAGKKLREIKQTIRSRYGYASCNMENLIHTADNGNEYCLQFKQLFPDRDIVQYAKFADMDVRIDGNEQAMIQALRTLNDESNLSWIGVVTSLDTLQHTKNAIKQFKDASLQCLLGVSGRYLVNGEELEMIGYLPSHLIHTDAEYFSLKKVSSFADFAAWIQRLRGLMVLGYTPTSKITLPLLKELKKHGVAGVTIYDARRDMRQVEDLEDLVEDEARMVFSGGGAGIVRAGEIALDRAEFEVLTKALMK